MIEPAMIDATLPALTVTNDPSGNRQNAEKNKINFLLLPSVGAGDIRKPIR